MFIVDAHLDLAYNAAAGRDVLRPAAQQAPDVDGIPSVGLPDLRAGGVRLICATVFCEPSLHGKPGYHTAAQANAQGRSQLNWYMQQVKTGVVRCVTTAEDLPILAADNEPLPAILLLEGADPILSPADAVWWFNQGVRIVGLAWKQTRYAGGTGAPGPLTGEGIELVRSLDAVQMIHDLSHLAEESFWQLLDLATGPIMASHSNCRAIVPTDRQLSDEMVRAVAARGGVIGINVFDKFLLPPAEYGKRRATLADIAHHARYLCDCIGDARHVGLGTDMDGGFGRDQIPVEIQTCADLPKVAQALSDAGFNDEDVGGIMGRNWVDFFRVALPVGNTAG